MAEVRLYTNSGYQWVIEGDIESCFDEISHSALVDRLRRRIADKRVVALVKAFLLAGVLSEDGRERDTVTGTPQGGILSPLLANLALTALDEHFVGAWESQMAGRVDRARRRRHEQPNYHMTRYADDFVIAVDGTLAQAEGLKDEAEAVLASIGLRLSKEKTQITHIDQGLDFLGWRIQRHRQRGGVKSFVYTYPARKALRAVTAKVRTLTRQARNLPLSILLHRLNPVLRGWTGYFKHGVSSVAFTYLRAFTWKRVVGWLRRKHPQASWKWLRRRYLRGWWPTDGAVVLFNPAGVRTTRYPYRGRNINSPWIVAAGSAA